MKKSLPIAYGMKRKKMADGGNIKGYWDAGVVADPYDEAKKQKPNPSPSPAPTSDVQEGLRKSFHYAKGGEIKGVHKSSMQIDKPKDKKEKMWAGESEAGQDLRNADINDSAMMHSKAAHAKILGEILSMKKPNLKGLAKGGFIHEEKASGYHSMPEDHEKMNEAAMMETNKKLGQHMVDMQASTSQEEQDMIDRIMMKRSKDLSSLDRYSEGGKVANETDIDCADSMPAQFDDLVLRDDLKSSYDGINAGDYLDNEQENEDRKDIIARIMASRKKKDKLPNPA